VNLLGTLFSWIRAAIQVDRLLLLLVHYPREHPTSLSQSAMPVTFYAAIS
jgi:hypothetical protein